MKADSIGLNGIATGPWGGVRSLARELLLTASVLLGWLLLVLLWSPSTTALLQQYWPIIGVAFVAALFANATAVGGGFVFLPFFSLYYGIGALPALKLALATQAFGMTAGAINWRRLLVPRTYWFTAMTAGAVGMALGTFVLVPDGDLIHRSFGWVSLFVGVALLVECVRARGAVFASSPSSTHRPSRAQWAGFGIVCVLGGLVNAWVSIGIGEVVALWLLFAWRFSVAQSVATGVAVLACCSVLGFLFHAGLGDMPWHFLVFTVPGVILGGRAGAKLGARLSQPTTRGVDGATLKMLVALVILLDGAVVLLLV